MARPNGGPSGHPSDLLNYFKTFNDRHQTSDDLLLQQSTDFRLERREVKVFHARSRIRLEAKSRPCRFSALHLTR
jgi:hypothetical protein